MLSRMFGGPCYETLYGVPKISFLVLLPPSILWIVRGLRVFKNIADFVGEDLGLIRLSWKESNYSQVEIVTSPKVVIFVNPNLYCLGLFAYYPQSQRAWFYLVTKLN